MRAVLVDLSVKCARRRGRLERLFARQLEIVGRHDADGAGVEQVADDRADRNAALGAVGALEHLVEEVQQHAALRAAARRHRRSP